MTLFSFQLSPSLGALVLAAAALVACGGSGSTEETSPSALTARMSKCPVLTATQDDTATTCLVGRYEGETLAGEACTFEVLANNDFEFTSPKLNVSYTAPADKTFIYSFASASDVNVLVWNLSDPIAVETYYDLHFTAAWGANYPAADRKISIEVAEKGPDGDTTVACVVAL